MIRFVPSRTELARVAGERSLVELVRDFGVDTAIDELNWPAPEAWAAQFVQTDEELDSLPFLALCEGVIAPLLSLSNARQQQLFGACWPTWTREDRRDRLDDFFSRPLGLSPREKVCWLTGERMGTGRPWSEDRLLRLLSHSYFLPHEPLRERLVEAGGVAALAARLEKSTHSLPLSSRVVTLCLLHPPPLQHACWPQLLGRCSALERYVLVAQLGGKLDLYWNGRQDVLVDLLAQYYHVASEQLRAATALEDLPALVQLLEEKGAEGLRSVVLRPLVALRPALAMSAEDSVRFPAFVECKYDGIRLLLHKELDSLGKLRVAAFTRRRHDWSELLPGLEHSMLSLPPASLILDGELHARVLEPSGVARPASVYEVHQTLRGELALPLRYVAFDLLYCNGADLTPLPFQARRQQLETLLAFSTQRMGTLPIELSQGSLATAPEQLQRLYTQYRQRGHEGCMIKDPQAPYPLGLRSPAWLKKKPLETVDLVLTAAFWGEGARPGAQLFDSYELSARSDTGWKVVNTVGQVNAVLTGQIVAEIWRSGLLTGNPRQRQGSRSRSVGVELRPALVVTVAYEDLLWDSETNQVTLRSGRIQGLRTGDVPLEESTPYAHLERLALHSRLK